MNNNIKTNNKQIKNNIIKINKLKNIKIQTNHNVQCKIHLL